MIVIFSVFFACLNFFGTIFLDNFDVPKYAYFYAFTYNILIFFDILVLFTLKKFLLIIQTNDGDIFLYTTFCMNLYERRFDMELNEFAKIGKGVLSKAIGLQKNYTEDYVKVRDTIDTVKSGCINCPYYNANLDSSYQDNKIILPECSSCSSAVWHTKYQVIHRRINERNRYGYQPTLKSNAIKLLLLYHFLQPDSYGFIKNVNIKDLAAVLNCTVSTINACNKVLSDYDYCHISDSGIVKNHISVYLTEYKNYHKTASEGGRGYLTLSSAMLKEIFSLHSLNALRMQLKGLLEIDNSRIKNISETSASASYKKLRGFLPQYCKNNVIKKALSEKTALLTAVLSKDGVEFSLNDSFTVSSLRNDMLSHSRKSIEALVMDINDAVDDFDSDLPDKKETALNTFTEMNIVRADKYKSVLLNADDYSSLSSLAVQYNLQIVLSAITQIYNTYFLQDKPVNNIGALCRIFIRNRSNILLAA